MNHSLIDRLYLKADRRSASLRSSLDPKWSLDEFLLNSDNSIRICFKLIRIFWIPIRFGSSDHDSIRSSDHDSIRIFDHDSIRISGSRFDSDFRITIRFDLL
ncbi:hypothetical protein CEXT_100521 [Caerostris extrusa]|uniref:Uncharacterized protein n=1 Tax=Caerostris extrusa TaxID=172846 RepID=A0AAV4M9G5_CAEEX|nr:hypothetical protein CEXT_100521 [Caerostris extrusa]